MAERVLIVGGGIVGLASAHYLGERGYRVALIDKGELGGACSHANCGFVCPSHVLPLTEPGAVRTALGSLFRPGAPFRVRPRPSPRMWKWFWQFARRCRRPAMLRAGRGIHALLESSMAEYRKLVQGGVLDGQWQEQGLLYVLRTPAGMESFARTADLVRREFGVAAVRIEGRDLPSVEPALRPGLAGAFHYTGDAHLRPDLLNRQWIDLLRRRGVEMEPGCALRKIRVRDGRIAGLLTSQGPREADRYLLAVGAWSSLWERDLGIPLPVEPGKGYSLTVERPSRCPKHPLLFPEHKVAATPFRDGFRLGSMMEFAGFDSSIPPARLRQLRRSAEPYLAEEPPRPDREAWYGWRPMTWDSLPVIGRVPSLSNAYLATGHNMLGLSMAAGTGRLIAELIGGDPPHIDPGPYSPRRFL